MADTVENTMAATEEEGEEKADETKDIDDKEKLTPLTLETIVEEEGVKAPSMALSRAKQKFNRAALKVLTQVMDSRAEKREQEEQHEQEELAETKKDGMKYRRPSRLSVSQNKRQMSLASVVGVMTFRKLYMSKLRQQTNKEKEREAQALKEEEEVEPPTPQITPRFCATLSAEAQLAMMKGYEDKILDNISKTFPDEKKGLVRVKTPSAKEVVLLENEDKSKKKMPQPEIVDKKQLLQRQSSTNFQMAMDILDDMKESRGELTTSIRSNATPITPGRGPVPPAGIPTHAPVRVSKTGPPGKATDRPGEKYNSWAKTWSKQFSTK